MSDSDSSSEFSLMSQETPEAQAASIETQTSDMASTTPKQTTIYQSLVSNL
jgi:hypothetical protein